MPATRAPAVVCALLVAAGACAGGPRPQGGTKQAAKEAGAPPPDLMDVLPRSIAAGAMRVTACKHGTMLYDPADRYIGASLEANGEWEEPAVAALMAALPEGGVAVDVGANIGVWAVALARKATASGRVYAYEPQPAAFQLLAANAALNGLTHLRAVPAAVGRGTAKVPIYDLSAEYGAAKGYNAGSIGLATTGTGQAGSGSAKYAQHEHLYRSVHMYSLDDELLHELARLDVMKIDVEGHEVAVLQGAEILIRKFRPALFVEADDILAPGWDCGSAPACASRRRRAARLMGLLEEYGYVCDYALTPLLQSGAARPLHAPQLLEAVSANVLCFHHRDEDSRSPDVVTRVLKARKALRGGSNTWPVSARGVISEPETRAAECRIPAWPVQPQEDDDDEG